MKSATKLTKRLSVLLLSESNNSMTQRLQVEVSRLGHRVSLKTGLRSSEMQAAVEETKPEIIICPFLKTFVPESVYSVPGRPCLIVHPGIIGDRGPSSLDWAVREGRATWGVTILEAAKEMDAGDVWSSAEFKVPTAATKSSLYRLQAQESAVRAIKDALVSFQKNLSRDSTPFVPRQVDPNDRSVEGRAMPTMKRADRRIDWSASLEEVDRALRSSESWPGSVASFPNLIPDHEFGLFGPRLETNASIISFARRNFASFYGVAPTPGTVIGHREGAILVALRETEAGVWISHLKPKAGKNYFKSKARVELPIPEELLVPASEEQLERSCDFKWSYVRFGERSRGFQQVYMREDPDLPITYLHFDFSGGASSAEQSWRLCGAVARACRDLRTRCRQELKSGKAMNPPLLVLMGGDQFFSNGIDLNWIHGAQAPDVASWISINAFNDVIKTFLLEPEVVVAAALRRNAGAGGVMLAAATDHVISGESVILNPSYKPMRLFGSEYWTHFLPSRVGPDTARLWTESPAPVGAHEAKDAGLVDALIPVPLGADDEDDAFVAEARRYAASLEIGAVRDRKLSLVGVAEGEALERARARELVEMRRCFLDEGFHEARRKFVMR